MPSLCDSPLGIEKPCLLAQTHGVEDRGLVMELVPGKPSPNAPRSFNTPLDRLPQANSGYQPQINLAWSSRKIIIFRTTRMESFENSPDADRHGGYSILR
jgi:hypothetical protein